MSFLRSSGTPWQAFGSSMIAYMGHIMQILLCCGGEMRFMMRGRHTCSVLC